MLTQAEQARKGTITRDCAGSGPKRRDRSRNSPRKNRRGECGDHAARKAVSGIGKGLSTKVNVNLGTSSTKVCPGDEIQKAIIAETFGADTVSDLSMGGEINAIREEIFSHTALPVTTVPVYQAVVENGLKQMTTDDIMATFRMQAGQGISSVVVHGVTRDMLGELRRNKRLLGMVSKGGSITSAFMLMNQCENPFVEHFDEVVFALQET